MAAILFPLLCVDIPVLHNQSLAQDQDVNLCDPRPVHHKPAVTKIRYNYTGGRFRSGTRSAPQISRNRETAILKVTIRHGDAKYYIM